MRIGTDPAAIEEMTASAAIFAGNFCVGQNQAIAAARCEATLYRESVLRRHVLGYLTDSLAGVADVKALGSRLAEDTGGNFAQIGWPTHTPNRLGVVELPANLAPAQVHLGTATGSVPLATAADRLLLTGGRHRLSIRPQTGPEVIADVSVMPRSRVALPGASSSQAGRAVGRLDPPGELFCYERGNLKMEGPLAAFNWGRAKLADTGTANAAPISRAFGVEIRVEDRLSQCGRECQEALGIVFAQAISVWRTGCGVCDANALVLLKVGNMVWLDSRIAGRLRAVSTTSAVSLDLAQKRPEEAARSVAAPSLSIPQMSVVGYEQLSSDPFLQSSICRASDSQAPWLATAKLLACQGSPSGTAIVRPVLRILGDSTQCGPGRDFLACGLPNAGVELAAGATRFILASSRGSVGIGQSDDGLEVPLRSVVMHEVGHWFGVPHYDEIGVHDGADIMASTLGDGQACVSGASLTMMNNAMDTRWRWRVSEGKGLRRPRGKLPSAPVQAPPPPVAPTRSR